MKPRLEDVEWFRIEMENYLEDAKYALVNALHASAAGYAPKGATSPSATAVTQMIKLIDSGMLLGRKAAESEKEDKMSEEEERKLRERLGLEAEAPKKKKEVKETSLEEYTDSEDCPF